ncbi:MAG: hypothetical protein NTX86_05810 [Candidatus Dependentiae bacterium]|nr:hypothetical protein [Candidatus Dependentiae bacterium]
MKNRILLSLLVLGVAPAAFASDGCCPKSCSSSSDCNTSCSSSTDCNTDECCGCPCAGKTYLSMRPLYTSQRAELIAGFRNDRMVAAAESCFNGAVEIVGFGGRTTKPSQLASYFLPQCKRTLEARGIITDANDKNTDLDVQNFNIFTVDRDFASTLTFKAQQSVGGVGFHYKQGFAFNDDHSTWWYGELSTSVQHVHNRMTLCETVTNSGGGADLERAPNAVANMTEAFRQDAWCFGKIDDCKNMTKTALADIEAKLGIEWMYNDTCKIGSYAGLIIPTGNKAKAIYVFEPIVGNGKHWGLMWGNDTMFEFWNNCDETLHAYFALATNAQYLFRNHQVRSFDLKNKPWSRYQETYLSFDQAQEANVLCNRSTTNATSGPLLATPGINIFTQEVKVTPGYSFNITTALVVRRDCGFEGELGFNFFARQAECVKLANSWCISPALKAANGCGDVNPIRDITGNHLLEEGGTLDFSQDNYNYSILTASDLDLGSAATPRILSYTIHGALGYRFDDMRFPIHASLGGSYEFGQRDFAVADRWTIFGKVGMAF